MPAGFAAPVWSKARGAPAYATLLLLLSLMFILKEHADAIADEIEHQRGLQHHRLQFHYIRGEKADLQPEAAICWARRMLRSNAHHRHQHHRSQSSPPPSRPIPFSSQHDGGVAAASVSRSPDLCGSRCAQSGGNTSHSVSSQDIDPRYGVDKRLVPTGPNPLHN